jgi:hypothetical protein
MERPGLGHDAIRLAGARERERLREGESLGEGRSKELDAGFYRGEEGEGEPGRGSGGGH